MATKSKKTTAKRTTRKAASAKSTKKKSTSKSKSSRTSAKRKSSKSTGGKSADKAKADKEDVVKIDRRRKADRRTIEAKEEVATETKAVERPLERRKKVNRRRQIDPTTCERDYSTDEIEFMSALDDYKRKSGRMFPTCSEVLEVIRGLGYRKPAEGEILPTSDVPPETSASDFMITVDESGASEQLVGTPLSIG